MGDILQMRWSLHQFLKIEKNQKMELAMSMGLEGSAYQCCLGRLRVECIPGNMSLSLHCPADWDHHETKEDLPWLVGVLVEFEEQNFPVEDRFHYALH